MNTIVNEAAAAVMPAQLRKLTREIERLAKTCPTAPEQLRTALAGALPGIFGSAGSARCARPPATQQLLDEHGAIWVRPRRAAKISGIGLTRLYELIAAGPAAGGVESRRLGGARLISVSSLLALGEEQAPQFPAALSAARQQRAEG
jgi:hypothetical protein